MALRKSAASLLYFSVTSLLLHHCHAKVINLTDENFDSLLSSSNEPWLVDIFAPWCAHCRALEPTWEKVAESLEGHVNVAKVDATQSKGLASRFFVQSFPTIVHLKDGSTRQFQGVRGEHQLTQFALEGWRQVDPVPFYMAPNSSFGRWLGLVLGLPGYVQRLYTYMHQKLHMSELAIVASFLCLPILMGVAFICLLDRVHTATSLQEAPVQHQHQQ